MVPRRPSPTTGRLAAVWLPTSILWQVSGYIGTAPGPAVDLREVAQVVTRGCEQAGGGEQGIELVFYECRCVWVEAEHGGQDGSGQVGQAVDAFVEQSSAAVGRLVPHCSACTAKEPELGGVEAGDVRAGDLHAVDVEQVLAIPLGRYSSFSMAASTRARVSRPNRGVVVQGHGHVRHACFACHIHRARFMPSASQPSPGHGRLPIVPQLTGSAPDSLVVDPDP